MTLWSVSPTFCGVTDAINVESDDLLGEFDVAIIGAPIDHGSTYKPGARFGPKHIREADYLEGYANRPEVASQLDPFDKLKVVDFGDVDTPVGYMHEALGNIHLAVEETFGYGIEKLIVLGGDHSISHATISATVEHLNKMSKLLDGPEARVAVLHWDAHADTALAHLGHKTHGTPMRYLIENEYVRAEDFYQVGLRGYWPETATFDWMREQGMKWWLMRDIRENGLRVVMNDIISKILTSGATHVWLSVDIDVCDPAFAPGTGTTEPGGLTSADLLESVFQAAWSLPIVGGEIVEVNPMVDSNDITGILANRVVLEMLRGMSSGMETIR